MFSNIFNRHSYDDRKLVDSFYKSGERFAKKIIYIGIFFLECINAVMYQTCNTNQILCVVIIIIEEFLKLLLSYTLFLAHL